MTVYGKLSIERELTKDPMFDHHYEITARVSKALMSIESCSTSIDGLPLTTDVLISLRESAKLAATHYSTFIEGNRLTAEQVGEVIVANGVTAASRQLLQVLRERREAQTR